MGIFLVMYTISGIIVFRDIKKENSKRDMTMFIVLMIIAFIFGVFYFKDPYQESLIEYLIQLMNM
jgi:tryptophan-rich sensory protein